MPTSNNAYEIDSQWKCNKLAFCNIFGLPYARCQILSQGKIEDLAHLDLGTYAIGAVEDCSKRFSDYVSIDVLNAIQRTNKKMSWVSTEPYDKDTCLIDFDVVLVEPRRLEKNLVEAIMWWARALNLANPR